MPLISSFVINDNFHNRGASQWDCFIDAHPFGRHTHLSAYKTLLDQVYGIKSYYVGFLDSDSQLRGILTASLIVNLFEKKLVSTPFSDYGGFLLQEAWNLPPEILKNALDNLLNITGAKYVHLKGVADATALQGVFSKHADCEFAILPLENPDALLKRFDYSIRKNIVRAEAKQLICNEDVATETFIESSYYPAYLRAMKKFGTPPHSLSFFLTMYRLMPGRVKIFTVGYEGEIFSILMGVVTEQSCYILTIFSEEDSLKLRHSDYVHWRMIKWAAEKGKKFFDFGVVRYEGQKKFKSKWAPVYFEYSHYLYFGKNTPCKVDFLSRPNLINSYWSRYMPDNLARILGPVIRKRLGR